MFILSSRSATVLVIFIVACIAFCLASVFGAMTGPISILPNDTDGGILDNLSVITDSNDHSNSYGQSDSNSYSSSDSSQSSDSQVETTVDTSPDTPDSDSKQDKENDEKTTDN